MPFGSWLPGHAGCLRWLVAVLLLTMVLQRLKPKMEMGELVPLPLNKLAGSPFLISAVFSGLAFLCRRGDGRRSRVLGSDVLGRWRSGGAEGFQAELQSCGSVASTLEDYPWPGVLESAVGRAHQRRRSLGSYAAHGGGRRAVSSGDYAACRSGRLAVFSALSHPLVEWRPSSFLPACVPNGRQWPFPATSTVTIHGSFVAPSGVVPGGSEVLVWEWLRSRLRSPLGFRGSLCKSQGPACIFLFYFGLFCKSTVFI